MARKKVSNGLPPGAFAAYQENRYGHLRGKYASAVKKYGKQRVRLYDGQVKVVGRTRRHSGVVPRPRRAAIATQTVTVGASNRQYSNELALAKAYVRQVADPLSVWQLPLPRKYPALITAATTSANANIGPYNGTGTPGGGYAGSFGMLITDSKYDTQWTTLAAASHSDPFSTSTSVNNSVTLSYNPGIPSIPDEQLTGVCIKGIKMEVNFIGAQSQGGGRVFYGVLPRTQSISFITSTTPDTIMAYPGVNVMSIADFASKHLEGHAVKLSIAADNFISTASECDDIAVPFFMWTGISNYQTTGNLTSLNDHCFQVRVECAYDVVPDFSVENNPACTLTGNQAPVSPDQLRAAEAANITTGASMNNAVQAVENGLHQVDRILKQVNDMYTRYGTTFLAAGAGALALMNGVVPDGIVI